MKVKAWQIAVIVLGLLIGAGSLAYTLSTNNEVEVKHVIHCIDVETGDLYRINTEKYPTVLPARHPASGRICLIRVKKDEKTGQWIVTGRDLGLLKALDKDVKNTVIDSNGDLLVTPKQAIEYVRK